MHDNEIGAVVGATRINDLTNTVLTTIEPMCVWKHQAQFLPARVLFSAHVACHLLRAPWQTELIVDLDRDTLSRRSLVRQFQHDHIHRRAARRQLHRR
jgi:hypothetical protein